MVEDIYKKQAAECFPHGRGESFICQTAMLKGMQVTATKSQRQCRYHRLDSESIASGEPSLGILKMGGLEKFGCLAMDTAICIKPDGSVVIPCIEFPEVVEKNDDLRAIYYGKQAQQARKDQGKYWFCEHCHLICMMMATSLVRLSPLIAIARQYLPQVVGRQRLKSKL